MKKKFGIGIVSLLFLSGGCGNAAEEVVVLGGKINMQESETMEESETFVDDMILEQDSEEPGTEEPENEELETEEVTTEEPETEEPSRKKSATIHNMPKQPTYIAQEFLDLLEQVLMKEAGPEALAEIVCDHELSEGELDAYRADEVVAEYIQRAEEERGGSFFKVDGDNDGIEDIFAWILDGGTLGDNSRWFLQGQADGSFRCTWRDFATTQELGFVRFGDVTYLLETDFDYDTKMTNGFIVNLFQEGDIMESLRVSKVRKSCEPHIIYQSEGYEKAAETYMEKDRSKWDDKPPVGTAEEKTVEISGNSYHNVYLSDLDNDGEEERYWKATFSSASLSTYRSLANGIYTENDNEEDGISILGTYELKHEGIPEIFWVDRIGDKNILLLYCYSREVDKDMLYGYLIEEGQATLVLELEYIGVPGFRYQIYTKGINYGSVYPFGIH